MVAMATFRGPLGSKVTVGFEVWFAAKLGCLCNEQSNVRKVTQRE